MSRKPILHPVYTGANTDVDPLEKENEAIGKSGQVVTTLMNLYLNKNHLCLFGISSIW
jgi:hypothetical protein